jgi:recombination protein RecT
MEEGLTPMPNRAGPPPISPPEKPKDRLDLVVAGIDSREQQFMAMLGPENWERWKAVALHALAQNTKVLRECDAASIVEAIRDSASLNLSPTGLMGEGWIIPYGGKAVFRPGWRGLLRLIRDSGRVSFVDVQIVYMNDAFDYELGTDPWIKHKPILYGEKNESGEYMAERGDFRGVYAWAMLDGSNLRLIEYLSWDDVMVVRDRSQAKQGDSPWNTFPGEMARKTALRRLMKRLPSNTMPKVAKAEQIDDEGDVIEGTAVEVPSPASTRASAAAYALTRGEVDSDTTGDASDDPEPSGAPTATVATCGALPPDEDYEGGVCAKDAGHDDLHRNAEGETWLIPRE